MAENYAVNVKPVQETADRPEGVAPKPQKVFERDLSSIVADIQLEPLPLKVSSTFRALY